MDNLGTVYDLKGTVSVGATPSPSPTASSSGVATSNPFGNAFHANPVLAFAIFGVAVFAIGAFAAQLWVRRSRDTTDESDFTFASPSWRLAQLLLVVVAFIAAFWHASSAKEGADNTTLAFLVFILAIIVMPVVSKISLPGGAAVELVKKEAKAEAVVLDDNTRIAILGMAAAARALTEMESVLLLNLRSTSITNADVVALVFEALTTGTKTVAEFLRPAPLHADDEPEVVRISAWLALRRKGETSPSRLRFAYGYPESLADDLVDYALPLGTDKSSPIYRTFTDNIAGNFATLPPSQRPPSPEDGTHYGGILMLPIYDLSETIGVLQIERARPDRFDATAVALGRALSAFYGSALTDPRLRRPSNISS